ncbi:hypothetical protein QEN19_001009 [Hanseniaspora menglaensis]
MKNLIYSSDKKGKESAPLSTKNETNNMKNIFQSNNFIQGSSHNNQNEEIYSDSSPSGNFKLPGIKQLLTKSDEEHQAANFERHDQLSPNRNFEDNRHSNQPPQYQMNPTFPYMYGYIPQYTMPAQYPFSLQQQQQYLSQMSNNLYNPTINQLPNGGLIFSPLVSKNNENPDEINSSINKNGEGNLLSINLQQHLSHQPQMPHQMLQPFRNTMPQQHISQNYKGYVPQSQQQPLYPIEQKQEEHPVETESLTKDKLSFTSNNIVERKKKSLKYKKRYICEICAEKAGVIEKKVNGEIYFIDFDTRDPKIVNSKHGKSSIPFSFSTSGHLARHSRLHTGVKNHICPVPMCGKRFGRRDNMRQHYKIHVKKGVGEFDSSSEEQQDIQQQSSVIGTEENGSSNTGNFAPKKNSNDKIDQKQKQDYQNSNTSIPTHDFAKEAQNIMTLQAQQQYIQQQHLVLQAQMGAPYHPLNMLAQKSNFVQGFANENHVYNNSNKAIETSSAEKSLSHNNMTEKENHNHKTLPRNQVTD